MNEYLQRIDPALVREVLTNPADNPVSVAILLAAVTLVLLILLLALLALTLPADRRRRTRDAKGRPTPGRAAPGRPGTSVRGPARAPMRRRPTSPARRAIIGAIVFVAFVLSLYIPGSVSGTCESCHTVAYEATSWKNGPHAGVACVSCHEPRPVLLFGEHALERLANTLTYAISQPTSATATVVDDRGCLRCHRAVADEIVSGPGTTDAIAMRHSDVIDAGYHCTDCHRDTGHAVAGVPTAALSGMQLCLTCHDGEVASTECGTCHIEDILTAAVARTGTYPKVELEEKKDCEGCHSMEPCDECHGLRMPHPEEYTTGGLHAKDAAFEGKKMCWTCHEPGECGAGCHLPNIGRFSMHNPEWKYSHSGPGLMDDPRACRGCHDAGSTGSFCRLCHPK